MEVREQRKVRDKEIHERKEVHERKGYRDLKGITLEERPAAGMLKQNFGRRSAGQKGKYAEMKEVLEEKKARKCGTTHKQNNNRWRGNRKESKSL